MYASLSGDISIDGSSTVFPITEAVAEEFGDLTGGNVRAVVGISGTGGGFKKFCSNETVISDASRPIKQKEVDLCAAAGVEYIEIPVAIDGLSVVVNPANDFVDCLTVDQLVKVVPRTEHRPLGAYNHHAGFEILRNPMQPFLQRRQGPRGQHVALIRIGQREDSNAVLHPVIVNRQRFYFLRCSRASLRFLNSGDSDGIPGWREKLHLVCHALRVNVNHRASLTRFQTVLRQILG